MPGLRRGAALARLAREAGMRLVAVYERDDRRRREAAAALGVTAYWELEPFLDHPMDAVIYLPRPPRVARRDADPMGDGVAR